MCRSCIHSEIQAHREGPKLIHRFIKLIGGVLNSYADSSNVSNRSEITALIPKIDGGCPKLFDYPKCLG